ncbi:serine-threonine protein kinase [Streptomyces sp. NPDC050610]|uniref:serine-threonine protein kinase n=1 Tax=Streptomyces sp. NPDC050610 TaxID=3157097 RepID=UPI003444E9CB
MAGFSVQPFWELTFDADGDVNTGQRDALTRDVARADLTDLVLFAHGWNNDRSMATRLYDRFFAPFPELLAGAEGVRVGYAGVFWPSMRFTDEPIPDFPSHTAAATASAARTGTGLDKDTRLALNTVFPGRVMTVARLAELLEKQPDSRSRLEEFASLVRQLAEAPSGSPAARFAADTDHDGPGSGVPTMLTDDPVKVCERFTSALAEAGDARPELFGGGLKRLWNGAREMLRQASYYGMKRRAGTVGQLGLGPVLGLLAHSSPTLRVHLIGHSFGGRLMSFALRGLPEGVDSVKSLTLLQGAFSHYAFAESLPHAAGRGGALRGAQSRVDGPVVACHSSHDTALSVLYPAASQLADDAESVLGIGDKRWGAVGFDGIKAVDACEKLTLAEALRGPFPATGCVSVDASAVVARGFPPAGAHSDICHKELARVALTAGRVIH